MLFLNYCIFSGSAKALVRCGGKLQHLLITYFSVTRVPNIIKIWQCFLQLQLKMSRMFFETQCTTGIDENTGNTRHATSRVITEMNKTNHAAIFAIW